MTKVFTAVYSDSVPANGRNNIYPSIKCNSGKLICTAIPMPSEGRVGDLVIKQTAGTSRAAVGELLKSKLPFPPGEAAVNASAAAPVELFRVLAPLAIGSGTALELDITNFQPYANIDYMGDRLERYLYLVLKPTGSSEITTWDVALTVWTETGR